MGLTSFLDDLKENAQRAVQVLEITKTAQEEKQRENPLYQKRQR